MTCSACSTRVEKSVAKLPGIKEVSVNLLKNSMVASYDESVLDTAGIIEAVEKAGYGAIPKTSIQNKSRATTTASKPEVNTAQAEYKQMKQRLLLSALFTIPLFYISMGHMMGGRSLRACWEWKMQSPLHLHNSCCSFLWYSSISNTIGWASRPCSTVLLTWTH